MGNWIKVRLGFVFVCFLIFFSFVGFRLLQLQVFRNDDLESLGKRQFQKINKKSAFRAPILDRNGEELAVSSPSSAVFARPRLIRQKRKTSRALAKVLGGTPSKWLEKLAGKKSFVWLQRHVPEGAAKRLAELKLVGIFAEPGNRRIYPNGPLAAHLLGFTDVDGNGIAGLELKLNKQLTEMEPRYALFRDGKGNPSYIDGTAVDEERSGKGIRLTIDRRIQNLVEEELETAKQETSGSVVLALVMDPYTGEIFAMAQNPYFDPGFPNRASPESLNNKWISSLYEPGSTLKTLFAAEAIQSGLLKRTSLIDCENGRMVFGNRAIHEAEADHKYRRITLEKVLQYSSNIGAAKVAGLLGVDRVRATIEKFGLNAKTGIFLPGETFSVSKKEETWLPIDLATVGFGQGIAATPLQIVSAYAPFANGGYLVRPRLLLEETKLGEGQSFELRRVLSPATVQTMRDILIGVTEEKNGTGASARIPGIRVAGKTGTAQKYEPGIGYDSKKYFSSFIGFLPAEKPELLVAVMVDEPKFPYYASQVAAPLFRRIAERALQILDRIPKQTVAQLHSPEKNVSEKKVEKQLPQPTTASGTMPDLKGMSMREAIRRTSRFLNDVKVTGDGYLTAQSPEPGDALTPDTVVSLHFTPTEF